MDAELQHFVDAAAEVAASGRWDAANKRIEELAANPGQGNEWHVQVLASLLSESFGEYLKLKHAFDDPRYDDSVLAWLARNLLELVVWALYCEKSEANARRLYKDFGSDQIGIYNAFEKWGTANGEPEEFLKLFSTAKQDLIQRATREGIVVDEDFKRVNEAAAECGLGNHFSLSFKMLSKFAHPTALRILGASDVAKAARRREVFFAWGCLFFRGAFESLQKQL